MRKYSLEGEKKEVFEYVCPEQGTVFQIKKNNIFWDNEYASVHYVQDITNYKFMDLDGLKFANDHFGHKAGDRYLTLFSDELRLISRHSDVLCRVGGDEFMAVFCNCPSKVLSDKIRALNKNLKRIQAEYPMSVSYGIIEVFKDSKLSAGELISLSDKKIYEMKLRRHKNRKD